MMWPMWNGPLAYGRAVVTNRLRVLIGQILANGGPALVDGLRHAHAAGAEVLVAIDTYPQSGRIAEWHAATRLRKPPRRMALRGSRDSGRRRPVLRRKPLNLLAFRPWQRIDALAAASPNPQERPQCRFPKPM